MICLTRDVICWSGLRERKTLLSHPLLLTTPECVRKDLRGYRNCRLTGSWEQRLRSSLNLRRTQQLFHFPSISTRWWCWELVSYESQFISLYCKQGRQQTQALPLFFLAFASIHISIADAKTGSTFLDHVRTMSPYKTSPHTSQARTPMEDRRISFWQADTSTTFGFGKKFILGQILFESHSPWKISSLHVPTMNRGQRLQKDQVLTTSLLHRSWPPYVVEGGLEFPRPQEKQTWKLPILCVTVLDVNVRKCKSASMLWSSFGSNGTRLHILLTGVQGQIWLERKASFL